MTATGPAGLTQMLRAALRVPESLLTVRSQEKYHGKGWLSADLASLSICC